MGVENAVLKEALRDPDNEQFVFISHNAVPLKSFDYVYEDLVVNSGKTSKFCFASAANEGGTADCRFRVVMRQCLLSPCFNMHRQSTLNHSTLWMMSGSPW